MLRCKRRGLRQKDALRCDTSTLFYTPPLYFFRILVENSFCNLSVSNSTAGLYRRAISSSREEQMFSFYFLLSLSLLKWKSSWSIMGSFQPLNTQEMMIEMKRDSWNVICGGGLIRKDDYFAGNINLLLFGNSYLHAHYYYLQWMKVQPQLRETPLPLCLCVCNNLSY